MYGSPSLKTGSNPISWVGFEVGCAVGTAVGTVVGCAEGCDDGCAVGIRVGCPLGLELGCVGRLEGWPVGCKVGVQIIADVLTGPLYDAPGGREIELSPLPAKAALLILTELAQLRTTLVKLEQFAKA